MTGLFAFRIFARNFAEKEIAEEILISFSYFVLMHEPGFRSNKPTHYLLDNGD